MKEINNVFLLFITAFIFITSIILMGECATVQAKEKEIKDEISNLSFSYDGKKVLFDRCRDDGCQIQVYDLETGELAAYQSPANERWTMARESYDGKKIVFPVIPIAGDDLNIKQMQIGIMDVDGKNYKKLTSDPFPKIYPTFSHSGKKVLYVKAGRIRKQGRTPASDYDAWEMDIETGKETRLTQFKYFYMSGVSYFPGDEKIFYYAEGPFAFPGLDLPDDINKALEMIGKEAAKRKIYLVGLLTIKRGDLFPQSPYNHFEEGNPPIRPLLSKDGTKLFFEAAAKSGKYYLYSQDGNHKHVGGGGSIDSAAISPDGELLGVISVHLAVDIYGVQDGKPQTSLYLQYAKKKIVNWEEAYKGSENLYKMIPEEPSRILNR